MSKVMKPTSKRISEPDGRGRVQDPGVSPQTRELFVINLCALAAPTAIARPQAPYLKRFTFFLSRQRANGRERFWLHMGYFQTLGDAEKWLKVVSATYPSAFASEAPADCLREQAADVQLTAAPDFRSKMPLGISLNVPTLYAASTEAPGVLPTRVVQDSKVGDDSPRTPALALPLAMQRQANSLSDTEVLMILEQRRDRGENEAGNDETAARDISMLRPEDTSTRHALRDAVERNGPVSFAVQLQWSIQPIELREVPQLAIFRAYTLYTASNTRDGRTWHCVRLGFFSDALSAKQVAYYVRSELVSAAVVPVTPQERAWAIESTRSSPTVNTW